MQGWELGVGSWEKASKHKNTGFLSATAPTFRKVEGAAFQFKNEENGALEKPTGFNNVVKHYG
jgi:hypothetical protein